MKDLFVKQLDDLRDAMINEAIEIDNAFAKLDEALVQTDHDLHERAVGIFVRHRQRVAGTLEAIIEQCQLLGYERSEPPPAALSEPADDGAGDLPPLGDQERPRFLFERSQQELAQMARQ